MDWTNIVVIVVLVAMIGFVAWRKYSSNKGKEELKKYLDSLADVFEKIIIKYLDQIDFNNLTNLAGVEKNILNEVVDELWNKSIQELSSYNTDKFNKMLIEKLLTKENVQAFAKQLFEQSKAVQADYTDKYNNAVVVAAKKAEAFEEETVRQNEEYAAEDLSKIEPAPEIEEPKQEIIPPHEDEQEVVEASDNSVEPVDDKDATDISDEING